MTLGKAFAYLELAREYRDMLQSLEFPTEGITDGSYEMQLRDCIELAETLDVLLDLVSTIEVVGD